MNCPGRILTLSSILTLLSCAAPAQSITGDYRTATGVRGGPTSGVKLKFKSRGSSSFELTGGL